MGEPPQFVLFGARRPTVLAAAAIIAGIFAHRALPHFASIYLCGAVVCVLAAVGGFRREIASSILLIFAIALLGVALAQLESFYFSPDNITHFTGESPRLAALEVRITQPPRVVKMPFSTPWAMPPKQVTIAAVVRVKSNDEWKPASGEMLLQIAEPHPDLAQGQIVRVFGMLERPGTAMNPGQFDWAAYYREQRILASMQISHANSIEILQQPGPSPIAWLRERTRHALAAGFPMARSLDHALLRALVLGDSDPELRDVQEEFRRTGTSHHLAISGMHVAVLGGLLFFASRLMRRPPRWAIAISLIFVIFYGLMALPSPPVVRSVLLCIAFGVGMFLRRTTDAIQLLALTVLMMLIYHPLDLYNAGFQLSFGTVLGLIVLTKRVELFMNDPDEQVARMLQKQTRFSEIRYRLRRTMKTTIIASVVAWIVSLPLLAFHFEQLNPWAIGASILLAPFVFVALIGGFFKIVLTVLFPSLASTWAAGAVMPIAAMRYALHLLARLPYSDMPFPTPAIWLIIGYYLLICLPLLPLKRPAMRRSLRLGPVVAFLMLASLPLSAGLIRPVPGERGLTATALAVGAGSCCVVQLPGGDTILIDDGSSSIQDLLRKCLGPYLRHSGISKLDAIFISHANYDHFSATADLVTTGDVEQVYLTPYFARNAKGNPLAEEMLRVLDAQCPPTIIAAGADIAPRRIKFELLWPPANQPADANDTSMVLRLVFANRSILFTGDIQDAAIRELLKNPRQLRSDILIAPHHGSAETRTATFIAAVDPSIIISSNDRTLTGKQRAFDKLVGNRAFYRTNRFGAVTASISPDGNIKVDTFLHPSAK